MPDELELELEASVFTKMRYLRILEIGEVQLDEDLTYLSKQLRFLNWRSYPSQYLPSNFESPYLYRLFLRASQTKKLWNGQKVSTNNAHVENSTLIRKTNMGWMGYSSPC